MTSTNSKVVNLDNSRSAQAFSVEESLWQYEIARMFDLLREHVEGLQDPDSRRTATHGSRHRRDPRAEGSNAHRSSPLSIALFGTYGSGKSSLLRTFVEQINQQQFPRHPQVTLRRA